MEIRRLATAALATAAIAGVLATPAQAQLDVGAQGMVAFACDELATGTPDICLRDVESATTVNLTNSFTAERAPKVSPDGTRVAFSREGEVVTMNLDGSDLRVVTSGDHPAWFPDSATLAVAYDNGGEGRRIWKVADEAAATAEPITDVADVAPDAPDVSARGEITFSGRPAGAAEAGNREIFTMAGDGSGLRQLTSYGGIRAAREPAWSPDGTLIAFSEPDVEQQLYSQLVVIQRGGAPWTTLEDGAGLAVDAPEWSPDGTQVAYWRSVSFSDGEISLIDFSANRTTLVESALRPEAPDWFLDGDPVAFLDDAKVVEGDAAAVTVRLSRPAAGGETVHFQAYPGTADGADFVPVDDQTVTFAAGQSTREVTVEVVEDATFEPEEVIGATLFAPTGLTLSDDTAQVTIDNDDDFPAEDGILAFQCDFRQVCLRAGAGGDVVMVSDGVRSHTDPVISPDGTRIAFTYEFGDVATMELDGGGLRVLAEGSDPSWYPSSQRLAYSEGFGNNLNPMYVSAVDDAPGAVPEHVAGPYYGFSLDPDVSPDGTTIVFSGRTETGDSPPRQLFEVPADGSSAPTALTALTGDGAALEPEYSPDGSRLAFVYQDGAAGPNDYELRTSAADGTGMQIVESGTVLYETPTWSPDGTRLAYARDGIGTDPSPQEIAVIGTDGTGRGTLVATASPPPRDPSWFAPVTVPELSVADTVATEGGEALVQVTLSEDPPSLVTVDYTTVAGTAKAGEDFTPQSGTLTFGPGNTVQAVNIPIADDSAAEGPESFTVQLAGAAGADIADGTGTVAIEADADARAASIVDASGSEGDPAAFLVTLDAPAVGGEQVTWAVAGATATVGEDLPAQSQTVSFQPGDTQAMFPVITTEDDQIEGPETYQVVLTGFTETVAGDDTATGTIVDDDLPAAAIGDASAGEGDEVALAVSLSAPAPPGGVSVDYATVPAASGDYTGRTGTLAIPAGESGGTILVQTTEDTIDELDETFEVQLSDPDGVTFADATGTVTIVDDDPTPELTIGDAQVTEGGLLTFRVDFSNTSSRPISFIWDTSTALGTAEPGDFTPASNQQTIAAAGAGSIDISVPTFADADGDAETLQVIVKSAVNATLGTKVIGAGTILEPLAVSIDDAAPVDEAETLQFPVTLTGPAPAGGVSVAYDTAAGEAESATAGADYTAASGTLHFAEGESGPKVVTVATIDDAADEGTESVTVGLENPTAGLILARASGSGAIFDLDEPAPVTVDVADAAAPEGAPVALQVTLSAPAAGDTPVQLAFAHGTTDAADFAVPVPAQVTVPSGQTSAAIPGASAQDGTDEPDETFTVTATLGGSSDAGTGTVVDDDAPPPQVRPQPEPTAAPQPAPSPAPQEPQPEPDRTVVAEPVKGKVLVKLPGTSLFVDLAQVKEIPNGTVIDARRGRVEIRAAQGAADDVAVFYDGIFKVSQRKGLTILTLQGRVGPCGSARRASAAATKKRRKKRRLWGSGKGRFRTAGKYASATVRGTKWLVEDSCSGTLTRVTEGTVTVRDNVKRKSVIVKRGKRYLAKPRRGRR